MTFASCRENLCFSFNYLIYRGKQEIFGKRPGWKFLLLMGEI